MLSMSYQNEDGRSSELSTRLRSINTNDRSYLHRDRRQKGGITTTEYEEIHGSSSIKKQPNFFWK